MLSLSEHIEAPPAFAEPAAVNIAAVAAWVAECEVREDPLLLVGLSARN